jgi:hypothetical protein
VTGAWRKGDERKARGERPKAKGERREAKGERGEMRGERRMSVRDAPGKSHEPDIGMSGHNAF